MDRAMSRIEAALSRIEGAASKVPGSGESSARGEALHLRVSAALGELDKLIESLEP